MDSKPNEWVTKWLGLNKESYEIMFNSKIKETQTYKHNFTQVCHIYTIVIKHAILHCLSIRDQCMCILKCVWMCYTKCLNNDVVTHIYELCVWALMPCKMEEGSWYLSIQETRYPFWRRHLHEMLIFFFEASFHQK